MVKNPPANAGDTGSIPGLGRSPGDGNGSPLQYSCLGNPMDRRSLVGYSPWGRKESDTTEGLSMHAHKMSMNAPLQLSAAEWWQLLYPAVFYRNHDSNFLWQLCHNLRVG